MKLESLTRLQTLQMEGNPVWSNTDYCSHLTSSLPSLSTLDQQDVTPEMKGSAKRFPALSQYSFFFLKTPKVEDKVRKLFHIFSPEGKCFHPISFSFIGGGRVRSVRDKLPRPLTRPWTSRGNTSDFKSVSLFDISKN